MKTKKKVASEAHTTKSYGEKFIEEILASENEGVEAFAQFSLYKRGELYQPRTVIETDELFIASDRAGQIHFKSKVNNKTRTYQGAGGTECS